MPEPPRTSIEPSRKRKRLVHACSQCRARKIRCDEARPRCTNCEKAGSQCITIDPRNPGVFVERREAQKPDQDLDPASRPTVANPLHTSEVKTPRSQTMQLSGQTGPNACTPISESRLSPNSERLPALPRHDPMYGNSLSMLSQWLDLAFFRLGIPGSSEYESLVGDKKLPKEHRATPAVNVLGELSNTEILVHTQMFMRSLNTVFPLFTQTSMECFFLDWQQTSQSTHDEQYENAESILVVLIIAANVQTSQPKLAETCLDVALCNFQLILDDRSVNCIRNLFLLSLIHRCRDDSFLASNMISLAASVAQTLGLHRQSLKTQRAEAGRSRSQECSSVWWSVYTLEKVISMELGRLSSIRDFECNQLLYSGSELILALVGLAKLQGEINEKFALSRHSEESNDDVETVIASKMKMVGELDQKLLDWARTLPPYAQTLSSTVDDPDLRFVMPFLTLQYWQTLFILHRNALLLNSLLITTSADKYCANEPYRLRIKNGHSICCNAARMIASILNDIYEREITSVLTSSYAALTAVYALGIHILKNPQLGLARADAEIQANAAGMVSKHQSQIGTYDAPESRALRNLLESLHTEVIARLNVYPPSGIGNSHRSRSDIASSSTNPTPDAAETSPPPTLISSLSYSWQLDIPTAGIDLEDSHDALSMMNIDWEALALVYDLPSQ